jgi:hypothetical protein|tara:strand:+ start:1647 stop:1919 length:273 start_codon:yes stop_codon:yes gene_type:complete
MDEVKVLNILNDLIEKDRNAMISILSQTYPTNKLVIEDYDVKLSKKGYIEMGLLTIINKIIESSGKKIIFDYEIDTFTGQMIDKNFKFEK